MCIWWWSLVRGTLLDVLGDDDVPVVPVDRFLAYLTHIGRSPNTVKAYAHDLKDYWVSSGGVAWTGARPGLKTSGSLRVAAASPGGAVRSVRSAVGGAQVTAVTVNRKLAAVSAFYAHQARTAPGSVTCWPRGRPAGGAAGSRSCTMSARASRIAAGRSRSGSR